ncbi:MAG: phosphoglucomutase/phosphomannomutase family protein [Deltaproteobacteria bacterium]|nr:phosphoglucomutase/phosphomannomutase family protein [Deltaproteobacteria bacterium]MBW2362384.1 phosphoglucomutase/phosphomannomutase family protein [Deltaproteobacteria bacterium]
MSRATAKRSSPRFGTSGWRGVWGEEFTLPRFRTVLRGSAAWFAENGGGEVVLVHDTRFLGERLAQQAHALLAEAGLSVCRGRGASPTPVAVRAVLRRRAAGAVVLTASHNPPEYQGVKVFGPDGAGVAGSEVRRIEALVARARDEEPPPSAPVRSRELRSAYVRELLRELDLAAFERARPRVVYDALHGAGAGVLDAVLEEAGARVETLRAAPDPHFGGVVPDPTAATLLGLRRRVGTLRGARLGIATDGDADRFAVVDERGRLLSATQALALLVEHCARSGRASRGVALSIATGSLAEKVAREHGLAVSRHPIGFKHFRAALLAGRADLAGEESGGFAWGRFHPDKDGVLAASLLTESLARGRAPLSERLARLERRHGRSCCGRVALALAPGQLDAFEKLRAAPPARLDGARVLAMRDDDGLHLALADGFVMLRPSGTEPLLRVYAEAPGRAALERRLGAGAAALGVLGGSLVSR